MPTGTLLPGDPRWLARVLVLASCALAFAIRLTGIDRQSLWRDESDSLVFATRNLGALLDSFVTPGENAPLYFLALRPWVALAGDSEFVLRLPSALAGAALPAVGAVLGWRVAGPRAGVLVALLLAVTPYLGWYGQEARVYTLYVLLFGLYLLGLSVLPRARWPLLVATAVLALVLPLLHILAPLFLAGAVAGALVLHGWGAWRRVLLVHLPVLLVLVPAAAWQARVLIDGVPSLYPEVDPALALGRTAIAWLGAIALPFSWGAPAALLAVIVLASRRRRPELALVVLVIVSLGLVVLVNERFPLYLERYLVPLLLPGLVLLAAFLADLTLRSRGWWAAPALLVVLWLPASLAQPDLKPDLRQAGAVMATGSPYAIVVAPWWEETVRYYQPGVRIITPPDHLAVDPAAPASIMPALLLGVDRVWLVMLEHTVWDPAQHIRGWLTANGRIVQGAIYNGVIVEEYELVRPPVPVVVPGPPAGS